MAPALALTACSPEEEAPRKLDGGASPSATAVQPAAVRPAFAPEEVQQADLAGELGCSFVQHGAAGPILIAMADVTDDARGDGLMKLGPSTLRLRAVDQGGFNAMVHGARFASGDLTATVVVTSHTAVGDGEAPPLPARLEISSKANGVQSLEGEWSCGP